MAATLMTALGRKQTLAAVWKSAAIGVSIGRTKHVAERAGLERRLFTRLPYTSPINPAMATCCDDEFDRGLTADRPATSLITKRVDRVGASDLKCVSDHGSYCDS